MFEAFLKENVIVPEVEKAVISKRFLGKDGKPVPWELRAISEEKHTEIKRDCTKRKRVKGRMETDFDNQRYLRRLAAASVVLPDLKNADLQKSWGVVGEEELLAAMLLPGEMTELQNRVQEINGFDLETAEQEMDEIKNS